MLGEVLDRLEGFELAGPVERVRTNKHVGVSHVPLPSGPGPPPGPVRPG